jgi:hypothetical protein
LQAGLKVEILLSDSRYSKRGRPMEVLTEHEKELIQIKKQLVVARRVQSYRINLLQTREFHLENLIKLNKG